MASSASPPPPDDPVEKARRISSLLVSEVRSRIGKASESPPHREFLNEGVSLSDVEVSIERLERNMLMRPLLKLEPGLPCLIDEDGIVPIDMLERFSSYSRDTSLASFLSGDFFAPDWSRQVWLSNFRIEFVKFGDVLDAVEQRLTSFLANRMREDLDADPNTGGNAGSDSGGSGGVSGGGRWFPQYPGAVEYAGAVEAGAEQAEPGDDLLKQFGTQKVIQQRGTLAAAAAGFTTVPRLRQFTVHTATSGLRIHYTPAYFINWSNVFGSPTSPVAGWLQAGRYKFGGMDASANFRFDNANFDSPPLTSATLVLK